MTFIHVFIISGLASTLDIGGAVKYLVEIADYLAGANINNGKDR